MTYILCTHNIENCFFNGKGKKCKLELIKHRQGATGKDKEKPPAEGEKREKPSAEEEKGEAVEYPAVISKIWFAEELR